MSKERRLGRGLEALLGRAGFDAAPATDGTAAVAPQPTPAASAARLILHAPEEVEQVAATLPTGEIGIGLIDPNPWQPRSVVEDADLAELTESLREHGLVQPIVVRARGGRYEVIAGQRRLMAARQLDVDDRQMAEIAIVENLQRRDLDALEKAASFKQYISSWGCTQEELAKRLSIDRSTVTNLLRLLELPEGVRQRLRSGGLTMGHARALLPLGDEEQQTHLAERIAKEGLSVRAIESEVQEILRADEDGHDGDASPTPLPRGLTGDVSVAEPAEGVAKRRPGRPAAKRSSQVAAVEQQLRRALGTKVVVHATSKGSGRIVIPFADHAEFQRLLAHMAG